MKKNFLVLTLVTALIWLALVSPVCAQTAEGYEYTVINGEATILDYQGDDGNLVIPSAFTGIPVVAISAYAFADNVTITAVTIPDTVKSVGEYAFLQCTALTSLTVGKNVADIARGGFKNCTSLSEIIWNAANVSDFLSTDEVFANAGTAGAGIAIVFGDGVETIPCNLFRANSVAANVVAITIGEKVKSIGDYAFTYCNCTSLVIPDKVKTIGKNAFSNSKFTSLSLGKDLQEIGKKAFIYCKNLTSVMIPASVKDIGDSAFRYCSALSKLTLRKGIKTIGNVAFCDCPTLKEVTIPKSVSDIGNFAFGFYYYGDGIYQTDLTISGYIYTAAQSYATENGFPFVPLGGDFSDVEDASWYEDPVNDLVAQGILSGYKNENRTYSFKPGNKITRAEFAVILAKTSGEDLTAYKNKTSFSDVDALGWSGAGIEWAYQNGIVYGTGSGKYGPSANITRQDMAVMICRFAVHQSIALSPIVNKVTFTDQSKITDYALNAVSSLQRAGIINGSASEGKLYFKPKDGASRAEAAIMISSLLSL